MDSNGVKKPAGRVISIDSAAQFGSGPELPPPSASGKRAFFGNRHTVRGVEIMFRNWSNVASTHHRVPVRIVEQIVIEAIYKRAA